MLCQTRAPAAALLPDLPGWMPDGKTHEEVANNVEGAIAAESKLLSKTVALQLDNYLKTAGCSLEHACRLNRIKAPLSQ